MRDLTNLGISIKSNVIKIQLNIIKNELKINNQLYLSSKNLLSLLKISPREEISNSKKLIEGAAANNKIPNLKSFNPMFLNILLITLIF